MIEDMPENARLADALAALREELDALAHRVDALEEARTVADAATAQRDLRAMRLRVGNLERQVKRHHDHFTREIRAIWHHPAIRRLARFNKFGLKLLGLFGLFGRADAAGTGRGGLQATQARSVRAPGNLGKTPADATALREEEETYLRGFCSLAHVRRPGPDDLAGEGLRLVVDAARLFSSELTGVGHYCEQFARALLRRTRHDIVAYSGKPLPQWILDYAGSPPFVHMPTDRALSDFSQIDKAPALEEIAGPYDAYLHASTSYYPLVRAPRMIAFLHDIAPILCPETVPERVVRGCEAYNRHLAQTAEAFVANSAYTKKTFVEFTDVDPNRVTVIHVGLDDLFRRPISEEDRARVRRKYGLDFPYVLCVGTLQPRKNLPRLVEAYARLRERGEKPPTLVLMGSAAWPETDALAELVANLQRDGHLIYTGYVDRTDMPAIYDQCELFVYPSYFEGYGMPVAEAMACGAPVVCAGTTSLPEVGGDAALYFDPLDIDSIALAISGTLADKDALAAMRAKSLEQSETYLSWDEFASRVLAFYRELRK